MIRADLTPRGFKIGDDAMDDIPSKLQNYVKLLELAPIQRPYEDQQLPYYS